MRKGLWEYLGFQPKEKFSLERLQYLYQQLLKNEIVTESNKSLVVETLRQISELMIWGDQHNPEFFEFFLEKDIISFFLRILSQKTSKQVKVQLIQTLSIMMQNISSETSTFFLLSNNHMNDLIEHRFDFSDEETLAYYMTFLKSLSLKLTKRTVQFFFNEKSQRFPLYSESIKFFNHEESMVRIAVRTITLNVYKVEEPTVRNFILRSSAVPYFTNLAWFIRNQFHGLDEMLEKFSNGTTTFSKLEDYIAEQLDHLYYLNDILNLNIPSMSLLLVDRLLRILFQPFIVRGAIPTAVETVRPNILRAPVSLFLLAQVFHILSNSLLVNILGTSMVHPHPPEFSSSFSSGNHHSSPPLFSGTIGTQGRVTPSPSPLIPPPLGSFHDLPETLQHALKAHGLFDDSKKGAQNVSPAGGEEENQSISESSADDEFYGVYSGELADSEVPTLETNPFRESLLECLEAADDRLVANTVTLLLTLVSNPGTKGSLLEKSGVLPRRLFKSKRLLSELTTPTTEDSPGILTDQSDSTPPPSSGGEPNQNTTSSSSSLIRRSSSSVLFPDLQLSSSPRRSRRRTSSGANAPSTILTSGGGGGGSRINTPRTPTKSLYGSPRGGFTSGVEKLNSASIAGSPRKTNLFDYDSQEDSSPQKDPSKTAKHGLQPTSQPQFSSQGLKSSRSALITCELLVVDESGDQPIRVVLTAGSGGETTQTPTRTQRPSSFFVSGSTQENSVSLNSTCDVPLGLSDSQSLPLPLESGCLPLTQTSSLTSGAEGAEQSDRTGEAETVDGFSSSQTDSRPLIPPEHLPAPVSMDSLGDMEGDGSQIVAFDMNEEEHHHDNDDEKERQENEFMASLTDDKFILKYDAPDLPVDSSEASQAEYPFALLTSLFKLLHRPIGVLRTHVVHLIARLIVDLLVCKTSTARLCPSHATILRLLYESAVERVRELELDAAKRLYLAWYFDDEYKEFTRSLGQRMEPAITHTSLLLDMPTCIRISDIGPMYRIPQTATEEVRSTLHQFFIKRYLYHKLLGIEEVPFPPNSLRPPGPGQELDMSNREAIGCTLPPANPKDKAIPRYLVSDGMMLFLVEPHPTHLSRAIVREAMPIIFLSVLDVPGSPQRLTLKCSIQGEQILPCATSMPEPTIQFENPTRAHTAKDFISRRSSDILRTKLRSIRTWVQSTATS